MKNYRKPRQEENPSRRARRASQKKVMLAGWIFLGVMLIAAVAAIILLLPGRDKTPDTEDRPLSVPQLNPVLRPRMEALIAEFTKRHGLGGAEFLFAGDATLLGCAWAALA